MANKIYWCLGCGRMKESSKDFPDGQYLCTKCRATHTIKIKCSVCGTMFDVKWDTFRTKDPNIPWRCRACNDKYRNEVFANRSDEYKQWFHDHQSNNTKKYWKDMSDEDRQKDSERRSQMWKDKRESGDAERMLKAMQKGRSDWWKSLTDEQKFQQWSYMNDGRDKWFKSMSEEERIEYSKMISDNLRKRWAGLSDEEKNAKMSNLRAGLNDFWNNITREKYHDWRKKLVDEMKVYKDNNPNEYVNEPSSIESGVMSMLNMNKLEFIFQYPSTIKHPDFDKVFPYNQALKTDLIDPYHMWDFLVKTKKTNVFIDVDGSFHNPEKVTTGEVMFNDKKRPYQTDGLPAYIIKCPNDKVDVTNIVENVTTKEKMTFTQFINMINFMNQPKIQKEDIAI